MMDEITLTEIIERLYKEETEKEDKEYEFDRYFSDFEREEIYKTEKKFEVWHISVYVPMGWVVGEALHIYRDFAGYRMDVTKLVSKRIEDLENDIEAKKEATENWHEKYSKGTGKSAVHIEKHYQTAKFRNTIIINFLKEVFGLEGNPVKDVVETKASASAKVMALVYHYRYTVGLHPELLRNKEKGEFDKKKVEALAEKQGLPKVQFYQNFLGVGKKYGKNPLSQLDKHDTIRQVIEILSNHVELADENAKELAMKALGENDSQLLNSYRN